MTKQEQCNACDTICNLCNETREVEGHNPEEDDGDCTTEIKCAICGDVTTAAKAQHSSTDDGDCTTPVKCAECDKCVVAAKTHDFEGAEWQSNELTHWHECKNDGCNVIDQKIDHTPDLDEATVTEPKRCSICEYIIEPQLSNETPTP